MQNSWNQGYYTDLEVYDGYTHELSPLNIDLNLTIAGFDCDSSLEYTESKGTNHRKYRHFISKHYKDFSQDSIESSLKNKGDSIESNSQEDSKNSNNIKSKLGNLEDSTNLTPTHHPINENNIESKLGNSQDSHIKDSKNSNLSPTHRPSKENTLSPTHHPIIKNKKPNKIGSLKPYKYLELGFGKGTSLNVHAASSLATFIGNDFNPAQALYARTFGRASGADIKIYDDSFAELESRLDSTIGVDAPDFKKFDYIVLHGVFSWINKENQEIILRIIRKYLKLGGVVYNGYNCLPGWASKMPARHIFALYNQFAHDAPFDRITNCVTFFEKLLACEPMFSKLNPQNLDFLEQMKNLPNSQKSYIAHEYLNADWEIFYFSDMVKLLDKAKLSFLCSGKVIEHFEEFSITAEGVAFLNTIDNKIFREQLKDYFINRQFRVDLFARAMRRISIFEAREKLLNTKFMLTRLKSEFDFKADTARGVIDLMRDRYENLLEILASSAYQPKSLREIITLSRLTFPQAMSSIMVLIHQGMASVAQDVNAAILSQTRAYNAFLFKEQSMRLSSLYVASPVAACAVVMSESEQIFAKAYNELCERDATFASFLAENSGVENNLVELFSALESSVVASLESGVLDSNNRASLESNLDSIALDSIAFSPRLKIDSNNKETLISYLTQYVFAAFKPQDRKHVKNGQILESDSENLAEIKRLATQFIESKLTLYTALAIC
ncbi:methyltransferase domain-containing protein [Helicobacter saguini]|uniref:Methyltransferase domain-containing protein n=1 Tax=Helicobacter saguini TaxID=1548018 RepID=A0A347VS79_9HELI|nr:class I SAM-dependent methyltransferase [Helicobacter saguini]MWV62619.1 methyltransferase domain-containing protein [Helicobacter saguini]MWV66709.1 methyltransferase domain-containing protein [Helicobacter saguini]MWV69059.1 methyltransferase domain-containing protein [Helicobacter saguini]MWV71387.1 methyltransferase domain-containing protein [Helicobacter saguini]TLD94018.1 methyltransferase domain-containing protein [Helicobacter saguini]